MGDYNWADLHKEATTVLSGEFSAVFTKVEPGQSQGGKSMLKCQLKIDAGPYTGRIIYHQFTISPESPQALKIFFAQLAALGLGAEFFEQNPSLETIASTLLGKRCIAVVEAREWQGTARENVKTFKQPLAGGIAMSLPGLANMEAATLPTVPAPSTPPPSLDENSEDPF